LHALTTFKYAHLKEKARMMVVRNDINDAELVEHMWGRPACCSNKSSGARHTVLKWDTIVSNAWALPMSGL